MKRFIKHLVSGIQNALCNSPFLSKVYLSCLGFISRRLPSGMSKSILANASTANWKDLSFGPRSSRVTKNTKVRLIPHTGEFDLSALFLKDLNYESEVFLHLEESLSKYDAIVEIGANVGVFTCFFSNLLQSIVKPIPVFAFEPSRKAYFRLMENLSHNKSANVFCFNCALSNETGFCDFFEPDGHLTNGSLSRDFSKTFSDNLQTNPVVTLSGSLLEKLLLPYKKVLFKIDVEGFEAQVLKSIKSIIDAKNQTSFLKC